MRSKADETLVVEKQFYYILMLSFLSGNDIFTGGNVIISIIKFSNLGCFYSFETSLFS